MAMLVAIHDIASAPYQIIQTLRHFNLEVIHRGRNLTPEYVAMIHFHQDNNIARK
jgi:hypothetical protein